MTMPPEGSQSQEPKAPEGTEEPKSKESKNEENLKALREKAAQADSIPTIQKELAMVKAGIDTETPMGKFFFEGYKGELTKEAVVSAAQELGLLEKPAVEPGTTTEEQSSTKERQKLVTGAAEAGLQSGKHPIEEAKEASKRILDEGGTFEQAGAGYLSTLMQRHAEGDKRATKDPRQPQQ